MGVALHAVRTNKGKREILIHQRLKEPFYGWYGSHSGKIRWGETPIECAKREFEEETGLIGDLNCVALSIITIFTNEDFLKINIFGFFELTIQKEN